MNLTERINFLAKKAKTEGLNEAEIKERDDLRRQYLENIRKNMRRTLDNVYIVNNDGNEEKLNKK